MATIFGQKSVIVEGAKTLSLAEVSAIAHKRMPEAVLLGVALPEEKDDVYRLDMKSPGPSKEGNRVMMMIDQYSGKITLNSETDFPNIGNSYLTWLTPLHYGTFGGMPTQDTRADRRTDPAFAIHHRLHHLVAEIQKTERKGNLCGTQAYHQRAGAGAYRQLPIGRYFVHHFKKGFRYALLLLICAFLSGALYGLLSGVIIQPALLAVLYTGISIGVNFVIALIVFAFTGIFLAPFKKDGKSAYKYFALSLPSWLFFCQR